jgi:hypothetical protein
VARKLLEKLDSENEPSPLTSPVENNNARHFSLYARHDEDDDDSDAVDDVNIVYFHNCFAILHLFTTLNHIVIFYLLQPGVPDFSPPIGSNIVSSFRSNLTNNNSYRYEDQDQVSNIL